jgi:tetratricopeptide (TPR) repeat protein
VVQKESAEEVLGFPLYYVYFNRALARQQLGKFKSAFDDLTQALSMVTSDADNFMMRAEIACDLERWSQAEQDLQQGLAINPEHPARFVTQIKLAKGKQQWDTALELLSPRINDVLFTPLSRPEYHLWRAEIYEERGNSVDAISDYVHYLLWRPDTPDKQEIVQKIGRLVQT